MATPTKPPPSYPSSNDTDCCPVDEHLWVSRLAYGPEAQQCLRCKRITGEWMDTVKTPGKFRVTDQWLSEARQIIGRFETIRDAFLEGRDAEAVKFIRETDPDQPGSRQFLPMNTDHPIGAGRAISFYNRPQTGSFKPEILVVEPHCAASFLILDVRVGNKSQFTTPQPLAATLAAGPLYSLQHGVEISPRLLQHHLGLRWDMDECQVAQDMFMAVQNIGAIPLVFRSILIGKVRNTGVY